MRLLEQGDWTRRLPVAACIALLLLFPVSFPSTSTTAAEIETKRPVVIAVYELGVNPYHETFRRSEWTDHPSSFIPGYPESAQAFPVTLDAPDYETARQEDSALWNSIEPGRLYYVPGTKILGAITIGSTETFEEDERGHGTLVADGAVGDIAGSAPDAAIVIVAASSPHHALEWIYNQPWIDLVSISRAAFLGAGIPSAYGPDLNPVTNWTPELYTALYWGHALTKQGKALFNGAGNGITRWTPGVNILSETVPPWVFSVGGYIGNGTDKDRYRICDLCDRPFHAAGPYKAVVASPHSYNETRNSGGTSYASPHLAGYGARLIQEARTMFDDWEGFRDGAYARAAPGTHLPAVGPLADGVFDRNELQDLLRQAATRLPTWEQTTHSPVLGGFKSSDPKWVSIPVPQETSYLYQGYGMFDEPAYQRALSALRGESTLPHRPHDDAWFQRFEALGYQYWYPWVCAYATEGETAKWPGCWTETTIETIGYLQSEVP